MKRISFFVSNIYQIGGIERVVTILANNLVATEKFEVEIISLFKTDKYPAFKLDERVSLSHIFDGTMDIRKNLVKICRGSRIYARKKKVELLITAGMGLVPITWLSFKPSKHIAWEHGNITIGKKLGITWFGRQIARKYLDAIVVLTECDRKNYERLFRSKSLIKHIYNPIFLEKKHVIYNADTKKIISTGRLTKQKGFDLLINVAKIVFLSYPEWKWDIYGDGEERKVLEKEIAKKNLQGNVYLKGFVNNITDLYSEYSIFVLTSRYEGFGLVITEAQSCKLPVVSFNCNCGPSELILDGQNGFLVDDFNIELMAAKICELIKDRQKRIEFSMKAQSDKEKCSVKHFVNSWIELIERV